MTIFKTALFCAALVGAAPAFAQTDISLGAINADPTEPLEITADSLRVDQDTGTAVFVGNVIAGQGELRLTGERVQVIYDDVSGEVIFLAASGGVTLVTATEAAEAETADYDLRAGTLVLLGNVLLTQGASAISSDEMRVDLTDGSAQMDGRVRTILTQGDN